MATIIKNGRLGPPQPSPVTPDSIPDLLGWWRSDVYVSGPPVDNWFDYIGVYFGTPNGTFAGYVSDTVGGLPTQVVTYQEYGVGNISHLQTGPIFPAFDLPTTGFTSFVVFKTKTQSNSFGTVLWSNGIFDLGVEAGSITARVGDNSVPYLSYSPFNNNTYYTARLYGKGTNQQLALNNSVVASDNNVTSYNIIAPGNISLFSKVQADPGDNSYAEVIIYYRALTPIEIIRIETYLRYKYKHY